MSQLNQTPSEHKSRILLLGQPVHYSVCYSLSRVITLLVLPHLFSKNGRRALVAYAFTLALAGPAANSLRNTKELTDSLSCVQVFSDLLNVSDISTNSLNSGTIQTELKISLNLTSINSSEIVEWELATIIHLFSQS